MEGWRHLPAGAKKRESGLWRGGAGARRCRAVQSGDADVVDRGASSMACSSGGVLLPFAVLLLLLVVLLLLLAVLLLLGPFSSLCSGGWLLTLLSAPDLYTASARFHVAFPLEYSPKVYQSTEPKRQETIY